MGEILCKLPFLGFFLDPVSFCFKLFKYFNLLSRGLSAGCSITSSCQGWKLEFCGLRPLIDRELLMCGGMELVGVCAHRFQGEELVTKFL